MRTLGIYSWHSYVTYRSSNYIHQVVDYISNVYSSYNWKVTHFECLHTIPLLLTSPPLVITNLTSALWICLSVGFWSAVDLQFSSVQFSSVAQSCLTLCDPMNRSTPGLPVHHQVPEFTQTHVHRVSNAIQASYSLSSPSPPAPNPS